MNRAFSMFVNICHLCNDISLSNSPFKEMCFKIATLWNSKKTLLKCIKTEKNKQYISCEILRFMKSEL